HPVLLLALAPERDADVADPHRLGDPRTPALLEHRAERRLAAARLAGDEDPPDARAAEIDAALARPLDRVGRVRGRAHGGRGAQGAGGGRGGSGRWVWPVRAGMGQRRSRSNEASAAPATNGPAL